MNVFGVGRASGSQEVTGGIAPRLPEAAAAAGFARAETVADADRGPVISLCFARIA